MIGNKNTGSGNQYNAKNDIIINHNYTSINENNLEENKRSIFENILLLNLKQATRTFEVLDKLQGLDNNVEIQIKVLKIFFKIVNKKDIEQKDLDFIKKHVDNEPIAKATFIYYLANNDNIEQANNIYNKSDKSNFFIKSIYIHKLIKPSEISSLVSDNFITMTTFEQLNLAFSCCLFGGSEQKEILINELQNLEQTNDVIFISHFLRIRSFYEKIGNTHYYLCSYEQKVLIDTLISDCKEILKTKKYDWRFVLNVICPLSEYIETTDDTFYTALLLEEQNIKIYFPHIWQTLALKNVDISATEEDIVFIYRKSKDDDNFKQNKLEEILSKEKWTLEDINFCFDFGNTQMIDLEKISIDTGTKAMNVICEIKIKLESCNSRKEKHLLENDLINSIDEPIDLSMLSMTFLINFCDQLLYDRLYALILSILKPTISTKDNLWFSPLVYIYSQALINLKQYQSFESLCSKIEPKSHNSGFHSITAMHYFHKKEYPLSVKHIESCLKENSNHINSWGLYSHLISNNLIDTTTNLFDFLTEEVFNDFNHPHIVNILYALTTVGKYDFVEKIIIKKFLENPKEYCITISNFFLNLMVGNIKLIETNNNEGVLKAVEYTVYDKSYKKIITENEFNHNEYCIYAKDELGQILLHTDIDKEEFCDQGEIILRKVNTIIGMISQICLDIRNEIGKGKDSVWSIPFDPNDVDKSVKRLLYFTNKSNEYNENLFKNNEIPYFMQSILYDKSDIVRSALVLMNNEDTAHKLQFIDDGIIAKDFIADVNTCVYLAITNMVNVLIANEYKIYLSEETQTILSNWVTDIESGKKLGLLQSHNEQLIFASKKEIQETTEDFRKNISLLLKNIEVLHIDSLDVPIGLVQMSNNDFIDTSSFTSSELALIHQIPFFTLDIMLARYVSTMNVPILNSMELIKNVVEQTSFKNRQKGLELFALYGLPYEGKFIDIVDYVRTKHDNRFYIVEKLLSNVTFPKTEVKRYILTSTTVLMLNEKLDKNFKSFEQVKFIENSYNRLLNVILYNVITLEEEFTAEKKLAEFIDVIVNYPIFPNDKKYFLNAVYLFCKGHFLSIDFINQELERIGKMKNNDVQSTKPLT